MTSTNLYLRLRALLPEAPVLSGTLTMAHDDGTATVTMPDGGSLRVRNPVLAAVSAPVYVQGDAIIDTAPDLPYVHIEI